MANPLPVPILEDPLIERTQLTSRIQREVHPSLALTDLTSTLGVIAAKKADLSPENAPFFPRNHVGFVVSSEGIQHLATRLAKKKWSLFTWNGLSLVVSPDSKVALALLNGDEAERTRRGTMIRQSVHTDRLRSIHKSGGYAVGPDVWKFHFSYIAPFPWKEGHPECEFQVWTLVYSSDMEATPPSIALPTGGYDRRVSGSRRFCITEYGSEIEIPSRYIGERGASAPKTPMPQPTDVKDPPVAEKKG